MDISEIKDTLLDNYDCILKIDAIRFMKKNFFSVKISDISKAYDLAYN